MKRFARGHVRVATLGERGRVPDHHRTLVDEMNEVPPNVNFLAQVLQRGVTRFDPQCPLVTHLYRKIHIIRLDLLNKCREGKGGGKPFTFIC